LAVPSSVAWSDIAALGTSAATPRGVIQIEVIRRSGAHARFKVSRTYGDTTLLQRELEADLVSMDTAHPLRSPAD
jgi:hypothetical protein